MSESSLKTVLFIGNSYIYYNDLPKMLEAMASASGIGVVTGVVTGGGFSLERHIELGNVEPALEGREPTAQWSSSKRVVRVPPISGCWDWVVIQEHSLRPLENPEKLIESAKHIARAVASLGSKTALLATWARQSSPETQPALSRAISNAAQQVSGTLVAAGDAWQAAILEGFDLHHSDGSHPNPTGYQSPLSARIPCPPPLTPPLPRCRTYLTACVLLATLLGRSPVGLPATLQAPAVDGAAAAAAGSPPLVSLDPEVARRLQGIAWAAATGEAGRPG
jgi:hypothetical protein